MSPAFPSLFLPWSVSLTGYHFINLHFLVDRAFSLSGLERCCSPNFSLALFPVTDLCHPSHCISVTCLSSLVAFDMVSSSLVSSILTIMCLRVLFVCVSLGGLHFLALWACLSHPLSSWVLLPRRQFTTFMMLAPVPALTVLSSFFKILFLSGFHFELVSIAVPSSSLIFSLVSI